MKQQLNVREIRQTSNHGLFFARYIVIVFKEDMGKQLDGILCQAGDFARSQVDTTLIRDDFGRTVDGVDDDFGKTIKS